MHLLSPADRVVAVTSDLASFWTTGYPGVRADLRGRYPRHAWPEDPAAATATTRPARRR
jgi:ATP-dependent helicase HrpB